VTSCGQLSAPGPRGLLYLKKGRDFWDSKAKLLESGRGGPPCGRNRIPAV